MEKEATEVAVVVVEFFFFFFFFVGMLTENSLYRLSLYNFMMVDK